ncbi:hypothetical protein KPL78_15415 [Roseomonas sp. HJA6]|uniref:Uncharacterized protein n=1 Tax=Roseomonas alba TaxID=2846776 RepID=A0ABS7AAC3_9PROT|nr:hypothetical protein [Neoroseomonas alba]
MTEGIIAGDRELVDIKVLSACHGMVVGVTVTHERFAAPLSRRRNLVGRTGSGPCGKGSLDQIRDASDRGSPPKPPARGRSPPPSNLAPVPSQPAAAAQ